MRKGIHKGGLALTLLWMGTTHAVAQTDVRGQKKCFASWSEAAPVVRREKLVGVDQLSRQVQARTGGGVVKSTLCTQGQRFQYRLVVRPRNGPLQSMSVDARQPFER